MDGLLAGRVAVITGGARGIGGAIVARFAEHGATGLVLDSEAVVAAAKLPEGFAGRAGDVTKEAQLAAVMAEAGRIFGRIDALVANAGIVPPWHETDGSRFRRMGPGIRGQCPRHRRGDEARHAIHEAERRGNRCDGLDQRC